MSYFTADLFCGAINNSEEDYGLVMVEDAPVTARSGVVGRGDLLLYDPG